MWKPMKHEVELSIHCGMTVTKTSWRFYLLEIWFVRGALDPLVWRNTQRSFLKSGSWWHRILVSPAFPFCLSAIATTCNRGTNWQTSDNLLISTNHEILPNLCDSDRFDKLHSGQLGSSAIQQNTGIRDQSFVQEHVSTKCSDWQYRGGGSSDDRRANVEFVRSSKRQRLRAPELPSRGSRRARTALPPRRLWGRLRGALHCSHTDHRQEKEEESRGKPDSIEVCFWSGPFFQIRRYSSFRWVVNSEVIPAWFMVLILVTVGECRTLLYKYMVRSIAEESQTRFLLVWVEQNLVI